MHHKAGNLYPKNIQTHLIHIETVNLRDCLVTMFSIIKSKNQKKKRKNVFNSYIFYLDKLRKHKYLKKK